MNANSLNACVQCSHPAVGEIGGVPLCVDCYTKFRNADTEAEKVKF